MERGEHEHFPVPRECLIEASVECETRGIKVYRRSRMPNSIIVWPEQKYAVLYHSVNDIETSQKKYSSPVSTIKECHHPQEDGERLRRILEALDAR